MARLKDIRILAQEEAGNVSGSPRDWMGYLDTASRLYRYPFQDTLLIHAQRPQATACAELELWNRKMNRWVNRGAKGIALLDDTGPRTVIRYVFDLADTHPVRGGRTPYLWRLQERHKNALLAHLTDTYGLAGDTADLNAALLEIAGNMAQDTLGEAMEGMQYELEDTFLEELDEDTIRVEFAALLTNSVFYSLSRRCGLDPMEYLEEEDFREITDFNSLSVLAFLGNAASRLAESVLRDIGRTVRRMEMEEEREKLQKTVEKADGTVYNEFSTLKRKTEKLEGGMENGTDLPPQGRLPVSEPDHVQGDAGNREIRDAAQDVPEREPAELVSEHDADREAEPAPAGDRGGGTGTDGSPDERTAGEVPGPGQGERPDGMDGAHEQPDSAGGGDRLDGIGLHLTDETGEQDLSEAEEETASALSLPGLPTVNEQIRRIEERAAARYAGEIAIPSEAVDEVLRRGGGRKGSRLRIIYNFMIGQEPEEYADFIRREYGTGGTGLEIGGTEYSVWYDELGMQISVGHTVTDRLLDKAFLSWEDVSGRILQLLRQGEYAPQSVLDAARENALTEHAQVLAFMERDMAEGVAELVFGDVEPFRGAFPDSIEKIRDLIAQPEYLSDLLERLEGLAEAYAEDEELMRFPLYRPDRVLAQFRKFAGEAVPYRAREGFAWQEHPVFITQDEIDAFLTGGGPYADGRLSTYAFFIQDKSDKEKTDFLRERYGTGGQMPALSGQDDFHADYNGKGLKLARGAYGNPEAEILLGWAKAAKRVDYLIEQDRFLKASDYSRMPGYEREKIAEQIAVFYSHMPEEIENPFAGGFFSGEAREGIVRLLEGEDTAEALAAKMDADLAAVPPDREDYERKAETLFTVHQYLEGTYTIFPERKKEVQIEGSPKQLSLFDFMGVETQGTEPARRKTPAGKTEQTPEAAQGQEKPEVPQEAEKPDGGPAEKEPAKTKTPETGRGSAVIYPGEKNHLPYDVVIEKLHFEEPEKGEPETEHASEYQEISEEEAVSAEERQEAEELQIEQSISEAMERADAYFEDFSPEQMDVVYEAAEKGLDIVLMLNPDFPPEQMQLIADVLEQMAAEERAAFGNGIGPLTGHVMTAEEVNEIRRDRRLPLEPSGESGRQTPDGQIGRQGVQEPETQVKISTEQPHNFRITDNDLGAGGPKQKFRANMDAVYLLKKLENEGRSATPEEQEVLSRFVGWGGIPQAFDENSREWSGEYAEVKAALTPEEYRAARGSTLNAFYTSPTVISAMYEALGEMGLTSGNVLEPSCGVGNFMGLLPEEMADVKMYGVELDGISGRIARQLYQKNPIAIQGFETTDYPENFFDCVVGNVPFGQYKVSDRRYDRHNFLIHDYFIAKSLDLVRPGGVVAVVTSSGTMDKQNASARKYFADRADLLGAVRLPNNAFLRNANTGVVADILFFQKRDRASLEQPEWVELGTTPEGYPINAYFAQHPEMVLGEITTENTQYGKQETTVKPVPGADLAVQLREAVRQIKGTITEPEMEDSDLSGEDFSIPADPAVKNFSFANVDGQVYYRENSRMNKMELPAATAERVLGMIALRDTTQELLQCQMEDGSDAEVAALQQKLSGQYDRFTARYGLISSTANRRAFSQDGSYCLLASLEILDEDGRLKRKADIFTKRTIRRPEPVTSVDTASEALAVSIGEKARVDIPFMAQLAGRSEDEITEELHGVIFRNPLTDQWETSDEYLSGNVREKLRIAREFAQNHPEFEVNVQSLERVQPKDLDASEIEVRLGATWVKPEYITQFMGETFHTPSYLLGRSIEVRYAEISGQWNISGKNADGYGNPLVTSTYGTSCANAYRLLEDALNLRDTKIYETVEEDGREKRVLNKKETMLAQQKQEVIREAFKDWVFRDLERREDLCRTYNERFNSIRPREYDGSHIRFAGMTPEITLMQHQKNAVAHILYGNNTLLAHCVGAGKTFQMIAAGMESRRLGLCQKSLYVVPNHLTEQWGSDFLRLYPGADVLVATKKDFEPANRKKFCSRIATGNYDAVIIGHSQFEKIPLSRERQVANIERQIEDITMAIAEASEEEGSRYTVKQMEKTRKNLEARLERLNDQTRKDDVVTFEQLGVDRLFVDESHYYKNLFLYTKMRNVAGISQTDAQKSSDMFMKCQYLDEITGGRGVTFATGTPVSNSMVELYTIMRYLQYDTLQKMGLGHFDSWAASFGETVTAIELSPEGTGYRAKTRFARFFNLPELISLFKESADIQTADMLALPVPEAEYINEVLQPSEEQQELVSSFAERAETVRSGSVDPRDDNMLKITNDGRKCALDQRLINDMLPDVPESKVNRCVKNVFDIWKETEAQRSAQLVFCDLSTPKNDGTFNVYDDVREKLAAMGIPREEIAFIHEANTETRKAELFAKVRSGQVRVLLGSTPKLGAGTNIQDRLIALHHLDCPWKPSDLEQQEGRILRQGNQNEKVRIYRYVTENTFDAYMWQILENKQKFISQIMTSKSPVRACEDVDDTALSYAEIKALATGNPYIKEKMDLDIQVAKLRLMKANHTSQKYRLESDISRKYPAQIAAVKERLEALKADAAAVKPILEKEKEKEEFAMEIGGKTYTDRKEAGTALIAACAGLKAVGTSGQIGQFCGFSMDAEFDSWNQKYMLTLKRRYSYKIEMGKDALGNLQRINNAFAGIERRLEETRQSLATLQQQLATAKEEVEKPFPKEQELAEKAERLAELNSLLNMDEKGSPEALGTGEDTRDDAADCPQKPVTAAEKARTADSGRRLSVLDKLHEAQERPAGRNNGRPGTEKKKEQAL